MDDADAIDSPLIAENDVEQQSNGILTQSEKETIRRAIREEIDELKEMAPLLKCVGVFVTLSTVGLMIGLVLFN